MAQSRQVSDKFLNIWLMKKPSASVLVKIAFDLLAIFCRTDGLLPSLWQPKNPFSGVDPKALWPVFRRFQMRIGSCFLLSQDLTVSKEWAKEWRASLADPNLSRHVSLKRAKATDFKVQGHKPYLEENMTLENTQLSAVDIAHSYIYIYMYIYMYMCVCITMRIYIYIYVCMYMYMYICMYVFLF